MSGKRVIVVEDDFLLAKDICDSLRETGAVVLGPAPTPFYAMHLMNRRRADAAVLDVMLHGTTVYELADLLVADGVPIVFATAYDRKDLPRRFQDAPLLTKPYLMEELMGVVQSLAQSPAPKRLVVSADLYGRNEAPAARFARALANSLGRSA